MDTWLQNVLIAVNSLETFSSLSHNILLFLIARRLSTLLVQLASFPGSPLAPTKNKNGGGEPGIDSHVISRHIDVTAIIAKIVTQLCSHVMG